MFKRRSVDPQKPVPSRSALSRERKRRRGSALSHMRKGNPHGGWKSSSLSRLPLWPLCPLRGRPSHRRRRDFLFPEGIPPLASFRVPGSQFRVGWEDSCSPARSLTLGQRGVPLPPPGTARRSLGDRYASLGPFRVAATA